MKRTTRTLLAGVAASAIWVSGAVAADGDLTAVDQTATSHASYVDLFGGYNLARGDAYDFDDDDFDPEFGLAARGALRHSEALSLQFDAWAESWSDRYYCISLCKKAKKSSSNAFWGGLGMHLVHDTSPDTRLGALFSLGHTDGRGAFSGVSGQFANVAIEGAHTADRFRIFGQAGYMLGIGDYAAEYAARDVYGHIVATYYARPNLSFSASFGGDYYHELDDPGYGWTAINWGGSIEYQHEGLPVSLYVAYKGRRGSDRESSLEWADHFLGVGLRVTADGLTLQGRDDAVGMADYNPLYGASFGH